MAWTFFSCKQSSLNKSTAQISVTAKFGPTILIHDQSEALKFRWTQQHTYRMILRKRGAGLLLFQSLLFIVMNVYVGRSFWIVMYILKSNYFLWFPIMLENDHTLESPPKKSDQATNKIARRGLIAGHNYLH